MSRRAQTQRSSVAISPRRIARESQPALVVFLKDQGIRVRCRDALKQLGRGGQLPPSVARYLARVIYARSQAEATRALDNQFAARGSPVAIAISDTFAGQATSALNAQPDATKWAAATRNRFGNKLLGMVAITDWAPKRVPDIDRVVGTDVALNALEKALQLTAQALDYKSPPEQHRPLPHPIKVRRVRLESELLEYFKLRHRVYSMMGYLDDELETDRFHMEVDWYDLNSVHIAAFEETEFGPRVVGTARIILTETVDPELARCTKSLARQSAVLRNKFKGPPSSLPLPVWGSQRVQSKITRMYEHKESHGELSRVIVAESHRGASLSRVLVQYALLVATEFKVDWLFLECVPIHRTLYGKFGFRKLQGTHARAVNVDKTLIAMECQPARAVEPGRPSVPESAQRVFREQSQLCCCRHRDCYLGEYARYGTTCPLRSRPRRPR